MTQEQNHGGKNDKRTINPIPEPYAESMLYAVAIRANIMA